MIDDAATASDKSWVWRPGNDAKCSCIQLIPATIDITHVRQHNSPLTFCATEMAWQSKVQHT